jgi:hypothetical protein
MAAVDIESLKKDLLQTLGQDLKGAKNEIEDYLTAKAQTYEKWAAGLLDGTLTKQLITDLLEGEKQVVSAILLKTALKLQLENEAKAKALAIKIALALINIILKKVGIPIQL